MNVRFKSCFLKSCYRELNSGPLPYQGSALPLSYYSKLRAENGAQTRDPQLGRLVLYQLSYFRITVCLEYKLSVPNSSKGVGGDGFEPPKAEPADLQSAPFVHSGNHPCFLFEPLVGFVPTTPRLQITCSGQLS